jgi:hypothetical protein
MSYGATRCEVVFCPERANRTQPGVLTLVWSCVKCALKVASSRGKAALHDINRPQTPNHSRHVQLADCMLDGVRVYFLHGRAVISPKPFTSFLHRSAGLKLPRLVRFGDRLPEPAFNHVIRVRRYRAITPKPSHHIGHNGAAKFLTV